MGSDHLIRVLGPIDVLTPDGPRSVGGAHARALLGALVLAGGRSVTTDVLLASMWADAPPRTARSAVQTYVWRLRGILGAEAIRSTDRAYQLDVRREQIDALRFEDLLRRAIDQRDEPDRCSASCRDALALWRGPPFGELEDHEFFRLEAMRLDELRLTMMELSLEAEVALEHHEIVAAELECAVREHPYRERLWLTYIDALKRDGRRVEALGACQELRSILADIGVEASSELEAIEADIVGSR